MCICKIGKCNNACTFKPSTGILECSVFGNIKPKEQCEEFIEYIDLGADNIETYYKTDIHINCPECGADYDEYDIEYEKKYVVECDECGTKFAFDYCPY